MRVVGCRDLDVTLRIDMPYAPVHAIPSRDGRVELTSVAIARWSAHHSPVVDLLALICFDTFMATCLLSAPVQ
jgi:hypothetical protein